MSVDNDTIQFAWYNCMLTGFQSLCGSAALFGYVFSHLCYIFFVADVDVFPYKTKKDHHRVSKETFTQEDLKFLPELTPPAFMPYGNVGTPVRVFLDLIKACRMPSRIIRKLQLQFPRTGSSRRYGNVPYTYEETETVVEEERVYTATGEEITEGEHLLEGEMANQGCGSEEGDREGPEKTTVEESPLDSVCTLVKECNYMMLVICLHLF